MTTSSFVFVESLIQTHITGFEHEPYLVGKVRKCSHTYSKRPFLNLV